MSSRVDERKQRGRRGRLAPARLLGDVAGGAMLAALVLVLCALVYQKCHRLGPYRTEYEGLIVNKSLTVQESETGSYPVRKLHVRGRDGRVFDVIVGGGLYARAEAGMWVRSARGVPELSWPPPGDAPPAREWRGGQ
jgi:hypothetical protein